MQVWHEVGYFNRPNPEIGYFYNKIGLDVTFGTTLLNHKLQMHSSRFETAKNNL